MGTASCNWVRPIFTTVMVRCDSDENEALSLRVLSIRVCEASIRARRAAAG